MHGDARPHDAMPREERATRKTRIGTEYENDALQLRVVVTISIGMRIS